MKITKLLFSLLILVFISGCDFVSNDDVRDAIDECNNDEECSLIIDEAIDKELSSRGIEGGKITNTELLTVYDVIESYKIDYDTEILQFAIQMVESATEEEKQNLATQGLSLEDFDSILITSNYIIQYSEYFHIRELNTENKQLFIKDDIKYIIYKQSSSRFVLEVYADSVITFMVDTDLSALYVDEIRLSRDGINKINELFDTYETIAGYSILRIDSLYYRVYTEENSFNLYAYDVSTKEMFFMSYTTEGEMSYPGFSIINVSNSSNSYGYGFELQLHINEGNFFEIIKSNLASLLFTSATGNATFDIDLNYDTHFKDTLAKIEEIYDLYESSVTR